MLYEVSADNSVLKLAKGEIPSGSRKSYSFGSVVKSHEKLRECWEAEGCPALQKQLVLYFLRQHLSETPNMEHARSTLRLLVDIRRLHELVQEAVSHHHPLPSSWRHEVLSSLLINLDPGREGRQLSSLRVLAVALRRRQTGGSGGSNALPSDRTASKKGRNCRTMEETAPMLIESSADTRAKGVAAVASSPAHSCSSIRGNGESAVKQASLMEDGLLPVLEDGFSRVEVAHDGPPQRISFSGRRVASQSSEWKAWLPVEDWAACVHQIRTLAGADARRGDDDTCSGSGLAHGPAGAAVDLLAALCAAEALLAREVQGGCAQFVAHDDALMPPMAMACCRYLSLLDRPVGDDAFDHIRPLGKGGYGKVWCSIKRDTGAVYAVKKMARHKIGAGSDAQHAVEEQRVMRLVHSRFVCALRYAYATRTQLCMVLDWLAGGTLAFHLRRRRKLVNSGLLTTPFSEAEVRFYAASITLGLEALHAAAVVYRDLKPENILLDLHGHIRITDLGLAVLLPDGQTATSKAGTRGWWAPEVARRCPYRFEVDWWCLGVTVYALLAHHSPFSHDHCVKQGILTSDGAVRQGAGALDGSTEEGKEEGKEGEPDAPDENLGDGGGGGGGGNGSEDALRVKRRADKKVRKAMSKEERKKADQDTLVCEYHPPPPSECLSEEVLELLERLMCKEPRLRLGMGGAHEVMAHAFFGEFPWTSLREGEYPPPLVPDADAINAGSVAEAGGADDEGGGKLSEEHRALFEGWAWRDERRMECEILDAIERDRRRLPSVWARICGGVCCVCSPRPTSMPSSEVEDSNEELEELHLDGVEEMPSHQHGVELTSLKVERV